MDYVEVTNYLFGLRGRGAKFGIERMVRFAAELGNPEKTFPIVHVAGTNGKGSVCAMLESIYRSAGYRVGLFTSPHLVRLGERIQVDRQLLAEEEIIGYTAELRVVAERIAAADPLMHPTFFEFLTAMAFLHFSRRKVDIAILEVGLGGRLDASNVVEPDLSIITSIGLDHCEILGDTLEKIAAEKAGIVKTGRPVVIGFLPPPARNVVESISRERSAPFYTVEQRWPDPSDLPVTNLEGEHQRRNAGTTVLAIEILQGKFPVSAEAVAQGLSGVNWAGRWQRVVVDGKQIVFEAAHNTEGAAALDKQLARLVAETGKLPVIALGALGESRARALVEVAARHARELHFFMPAQPRALPFEILEKLVPASFTGPVVRSDVESAFGAGTCRLGRPDDTVVITGSIYLIGETLQRLQSSARPIETVLQG